MVNFLKGLAWLVLGVVAIVALLLYMGLMGRCEVCKKPGQSIVNDYGSLRVLCKEHAVVVLQTEPNR